MTSEFIAPKCHYLGFVHNDSSAEDPLSLEGVKKVSTMFRSKRTLKQTREIHPLWARGVSSVCRLQQSRTALNLLPTKTRHRRKSSSGSLSSFLSRSFSNLSGSLTGLNAITPSPPMSPPLSPCPSPTPADLDEDQNVILDLPFKKICFVAAIKRQLFVVVRRAAEKYKTHVFQLPKGSEAFRLAERLQPFSASTLRRSKSLFALNRDSLVESSSPLTDLSFFPRHNSDASTPLRSKGSNLLRSQSSYELSVSMDSVFGFPGEQIVSPATSMDSLFGSEFDLSSPSPLELSSSSFGSLMSFCEVQDNLPEEQQSEEFPDPGDCDICHDHLSTSTWVTLRQCVHAFHEECIHEHRGKFGSCPTCKVPLSPTTFLCKLHGCKQVRLPDTEHMQGQAKQLMTTAPKESARLKFNKTFLRLSGTHVKVKRNLTLITNAVALSEHQLAFAVKLKPSSMCQNPGFMMYVLSVCPDLAATYVVESLLRHKSEGVEKDDTDC
eukprot:m.65898 g.65898  ORF g.65898 m.65898 type:complete len:494 (-) comp19670_c0_seq1:22-1503(-)